MAANRFVAILAVWTLWEVCGAVVSAAEAEGPAKRPLTLLVQGLQWDVEKPTAVWGKSVAEKPGESKWTGMIGALEASGWRFGGVVRPQGAAFDLPAVLDRSGTAGEAHEATLFELRFSPSAQADGLAYKALEIVACLRALRAFTQTEKVCLVAHSAGGLAARTYVQNALPGVEFAHDVDRLITIGSPHLGSVAANNVGDVLGTRATSLGLEADLIRRLNETLPLPTDVLYAAIVVRGFRADVGGDPSAYRDAYDADMLAKLPLDFRTGGDETVPTVSQNLALAKVSREYERATGRPVQFLLARVTDPSVSDLNVAGRRVHNVETYDPQVLAHAVRLLAPDAPFWTGFADAKAESEWTEAQARLAALGTIELAAKERHALSEIVEVRDLAVERHDDRDGLRSYAFSGTALSRKKIVGFKKRAIAVSGELQIRFDKFGRPVECRHTVTRVQER